MKRINHNLKFTHLLSIAALLGAFGCTSDHPIENSSNYLTEDMIELNGRSPKPLAISAQLTDSDFRLAPVKHLSASPDNLLYVSEYIYSEVDSVIKIFDLKTGKYIKHLAEYGDAPEQVLFSNGLHFSGNTVSFLDDQKIMLNYWPYDTWDGVAYPPLEAETVNANVGLIGDGAVSGNRITSILLEDITQEGKELASKNIFENNWKFYDSFPVRTSSQEEPRLDKRLKPATYESILSLSKDGKALALGYTYTDKIKVLNSDLSRRYILVGPDNFDPDFQTFETSRGGVSRQPIKELTRYAWLSFASSDNYLFGLYSGKLLGYEGQPEDYKSSVGNIIYEIDWETGRVKNVFELEGTANYRIAVSADGTKIYAATDEGDTHIDVYDVLNE